MYLLVFCLCSYWFYLCVEDSSYRLGADHCYLHILLLMVLMVMLLILLTSGVLEGLSAITAGGFTSGVLFNRVTPYF